MAEWKDFFQFNEGDTFKIIEEDTLIGDGSANYIFDAIGKVEEISSSLLTLGFDINQQDMPTSGLLSIITGKSILPIPKIQGTISIRLIDVDGYNRLEVQGKFIDSEGIEKDFDFTDIRLQVRVNNSKERIRLDASNTFLSQISDDSSISALGRIQFQKHSNLNKNELDVGKLPLGGKIDLILEKES